MARGSALKFCWPQIFNSEKKMDSGYIPQFLPFSAPISLVGMWVWLSLHFFHYLLRGCEPNLQSSTWGSKLLRLKMKNIQK